MAIPGNMWIYDDGGALIKGGCDVADREFSIEFKGFHHNLSIPTDNATGKPTGTRQHSPMIIVKRIRLFQSIPLQSSSYWSETRNLLKSNGIKSAMLVKKWNTSICYLKASESYQYLLQWLPRRQEQQPS